MSFLDPLFLPFLSLFLSGHLLSIFLIKSNQALVVWGLLASTIFIGYYSWLLLPLLPLLTLSTWIFSRLVAARRRRSLLAFALALLLLPLLIFKYGEFLSSGYFSPLAYLALPLGISFYTFQNISYLIDSSRHTRGSRQQHQQSPSLLRYLYYISFFPQLVAGPIVRSAEFLPQMERLRTIGERVDLRGGSFLLLSGFFLKGAIADRLAVMVVDPVFSSGVGYSHFATLHLWLALYGYSFQIYLDFSAYTMIALGVGRMAGFRLPENFAFPYLAAGARDFWRRWHITLSRWLRDYLYIPLGGSRYGRWRFYMAIVVTMLLGGLWHGAAVTFLVWGALHAFFLILDRFVSEKWRSGGLRRVLYVQFTFFLVTLFWLPFRIGSQGVEALLDYLFHLFLWRSGDLPEDALQLVVVVWLAVLLAPTAFNRISRWWRHAPLPILILVASVATILCSIVIASEESFIYFVF